MSRDFIDSRLGAYAAERLGDRTIQYLDRYWMDRGHLEDQWGPLLETVFTRSSGKVSVAGGYQVDFLQGGILFTEDEFQAFAAQARRAGARRFAVVEDVGQDRWYALEAMDFFRFAYPLDVDWNEMTRSCLVAEDVFERPIRCFFVITDNGKVGKYANNDAERPYDLVFHA